MKAAIIAVAATMATPAVADDLRSTHGEKLGEVFFEFDSARAEGKDPTVETIVAWAEEHPNMTIVLDGHADPRGTEAYNVGLATRRAHTIRCKLEAAGIAKDRILVVTFGEDGKRRPSFAQDRRVTAWATSDPLYEIIDESLDPATAVLWSEPVDQTALLSPEQNEAREQVALP